jgi:uncharacterized protein with ATP-grasp and redox domains
MIKLRAMSDFLFGKEMKVHPECFPCFLRQCVIAIDLSGRNGADANEVIKAALEDIQNADLEKSPAHATTDMHRTLRRMLGGDPFKEVKQRYNKIALGLYDSLKKKIANSEDPLATAARLAIAGNVIDFGIYSAIDIEGTVERALGEPLSVDHTAAFKQAVRRAGDVLYLLDNAGEAVFDRLLIEDLIARGKKVTAVVKAAPIINDCTMEDALEVGLTEVCEVVDNGSDAVGTILETTSDEFKNLYEGAGLVISKGQGNFETLLDQRGTSSPLGDPPKKEIYFLFQSTCGVVSRVLGLSEGSMLLVGG